MTFDQIIFGCYFFYYDSSFLNNHKIFLIFHNVKEICLNYLSNKRNSFWINFLFLYSYHYYILIHSIFCDILKDHILLINILNLFYFCFYLLYLNLNFLLNLRFLFLNLLLVIYVFDLFDN